MAPQRRKSSKSSDMGSKRLIGLAPDAWVQLVTQRSNVQAREVLESEFQWLSRDSDAIVRAYSPEVGEFLVLTEVQTHYSAHLPRRMSAYAALAEERFDLAVYPVLVNILPPAPEQPVARYASEVLGLSSQREYRVLNLWTVEAEQVVTQPIAPLLPFVPVLRGGQAETVIRRAVELLRADAQLQGLERLLAFFASFVLSTALVEKLMRWDMTVIQDSPWYQEIIARGEQTGERRGRQEGRQEEAFRQLLRILQYRFPALPEALPARLQPLTVEQLESLVDAALAATSLDDFAAQIPH